MNNLEARLSWPEWRIKNGESIERSHACILNRGCFASRSFILISRRARLYRADESLNFYPAYQATTLTKRGKQNSFFASASRFRGTGYSVTHRPTFLTIIYGNGRTRRSDSTATVAAARAYRRNHYFFILAAGRLLFRRWNKCRRIHSIIQTWGFFPADCRIMSQ